MAETPEARVTRLGMAVDELHQAAGHLHAARVWLMNEPVNNLIGEVLRMLTAIEADIPVKATPKWVSTDG